MDRARSWLLRRLLALWVRYKVRPDEAVSHVRDRDKPVCYVVENSSVTDLAVLQDACVKLKLPRPQKRLLRQSKDLRSFFYLSRPRGFWDERKDKRKLLSPRLLQCDFRLAFRVEKLEMAQQGSSTHQGRCSLPQPEIGRASCRERV